MKLSDPRHAWRGAGRPRRLVECNGRTLSIDGWVAVTGLSKSVIRNRLKKGIPLDAPRMSHVPPRKEPTR